MALPESQDAGAGAILLLDEPGLSLPPLAQRDLSEFFASLAEKNQLLYTTHSPFLVDPDHLDRVKAVFVQDDGTTGVSSDLRAGEKDRQQKQSIYPVHAALGLSVSDIILSGAQPVIVEGTSDQIYLSAIKVLLIAASRIRPARELIFIPAGGVRGIKALPSILTGKDDELPHVLVDADGAGAKLASDLKTSLYAGDKNLVMDVSGYGAVDRAEIEDVLPPDMVADVASRIVRSLD
ncbi:MAG: ATP-dependent nuclease, partial [Gemmatimonadaceae bacterium]